MKCKYCSRECHVAHICPYCQECFCISHRNPTDHNCGAGHIFIKDENVSKTKLEIIREKMFAPIFIMLIVDQTMRWISYTRHSPYLEPNIYVLMLSQWINPYAASALIFMSACLTMLTVNKLTAKNSPSNQSQQAMFANTVAIGTYITMILIFLPTAVTWFKLLLT